MTSWIIKDNTRQGGFLHIYPVMDIAAHQPTVCCPCGPVQDEERVEIMTHKNYLGLYGELEGCYAHYISHMPEWIPDREISC